MLNEERLVTPEHVQDDLAELSLRPRFLSEYIGQQNVKDNLNIFIEAAKKREESLDHVLLHGSPGLGKTTLAHIIANEMSTNIRMTSGPAIERPGDLAAILTNLGEHDVLFIDEIHRLNRVVEEILYPAMEEYALDIIIGKGPSAKAIRLNLPPFTLIGATTRAGLLTSPLRDRFGIVCRLDYYSSEELEKVVTRASGILRIPVEPAGSTEIAKRSRGTPRIANRLLRRVRDYAEVEGSGIITQEIANKGLMLLGVDKMGLDSIDRKLLETIICKFDGGPVGLDTLSASIGEERVTIEEVYEPYLLQIGFLNRTQRGRTATRLAYEHLGFQQDEVGETSKAEDTTLFDL